MLSKRLVGMERKRLLYVECLKLKHSRRTGKRPAEIDYKIRKKKNQCEFLRKYALEMDF